MYKFIKYKTGFLISEWCFEPQSLNDVLEFSMTYTKGFINTEFGKMCQSLFKNFDQKESTDPGSPYEIGIRLILETYGVSPIMASTKLIKDTIDGRILSWRNGHRCFYPRDGFRCIGFDSRFSEVCDEIYKETLVFPDIDRPSIEDVKLLQWPGGKHWYAKIGNLDVVIDNIQKWNTKIDAMEASKKFIDKNWK